jgi:hypothetical protein
VRIEFVIRTSPGWLAEIGCSDISVRVVYITLQSSNGPNLAVMFTLINLRKWKALSVLNLFSVQI